MGRLAQTLAALWRLTGARHLNLIAAGVAFYALLAVFPALAATLAIAGLIIDPTVVAEFLSLAADFLPQDALDLLDAQAARLLSADASALGWTTVASVVFAIWSARRGVNALAQGLTAIHGGQSRAGLGDVLVALSLTVVLILVGVVALVAVFLTPIILALLSIVLPADSWLPAITEALRWVVAVMVLVVGLGLFYRYGPNRPGQPRSPFFSVGMAVALALWVAASVGFNLFLANFSNYNEVYGSIGAVVALLMWFYISAYAVLIGAAVNSLIEAPEGQAGKG